MKKILLITGSMNQTTQMHQIYEHLKHDFDCYFSQFFGSHPIVRTVVNSGLMNNTILAGRFRKEAEDYLEKNGLRNDYAMQRYKHQYDLVILCNDIMVPKEFRTTKTVFVQEGMVDPMNLKAHIAKILKLPRYLAFNTALNGSSNLCDIYCTASEGYSQFFTKMGSAKEKMVVTGIPNYDDAVSFRKNNFPHKGYVMIATSDLREVFGKEDRVANIKKWTEIANGRPMLFKLHPNEVYERSAGEIKEHAPEGTLIYQQGNTNEMIANSVELITQRSTVVYIGMALGIPVHSDFDLEGLRRLLPVQNGGKSAENIAELCRQYIGYQGTGIQFLKQFKVKTPPIIPTTVSAPGNRKDETTHTEKLGASVATE